MNNILAVRSRAILILAIFVVSRSGLALILPGGAGLLDSWSFNDTKAKAGFDENYEPNEQGRMLEDLIDRFFVR